MLVTAYDKRTGKKHPHPVPQRWLDKGVVAPYLTASESAATSAAKRATEKPENTVEGTTTGTGKQSRGQKEDG